MPTAALPKLTPAQQRALLALHAGVAAGTIRADVRERLHTLKMTKRLRHGWTMTDLGRVVAEELRAAATTPARPVQRPQEATADLVGALLHHTPSNAPPGLPDGLYRALRDLGTDKARYAALAWLADAPGTTWLGSLKDALVVASNQAGRTYAGTSEHLGITPATVNRSVSRHRARNRQATEG